MANMSPIALRACAAFQIFTDLCILAQFAIYRNSKPTYEPVDTKATPKIEETKKISVADK